VGGVDRGEVRMVQCGSMGDILWLCLVTRVVPRIWLRKLHSCLNVRNGSGFGFGMNRSY
jgi:hypothetical protein